MFREKIAELKKRFNSSCWITPNQFHFYCKGVDQAVDLLENEVKKGSPKIICYCGSLRFKEYFEKFEYNSIFKGEIALLPCCMYVDIEREYGATSEYKQKADEQHKRKIDICDEVFIINVGGYIGESTRSEIEYALSINKPVVYLYE